MENLSQPHKNDVKKLEVSAPKKHFSKISAIDQVLPSLAGLVLSVCVINKKREATILLQGISQALHIIK